MKTIPLFYFPTTLIIVDDEDSMLQFLTTELGDEFKLITEKSPMAAIKVIKENEADFNLTNLIIRDSEDDSRHENTSVIKIDVSNILEIAYKPDRYNIISTIVADYEMPVMSGMELCRILKDFQLNKILLTGKADEGKVIEAFNWELIDRYVKKDKSSFIKNLRTQVIEMRLQYFIKLSNNIKPISQKLAILSDPAFINLFNTIAQQYSVQEYYLIDKNGSFLLIDAKGKKIVLAISTDEDLEMFGQFYKDEPAAQEYISLVEKKKNMPFFGIGTNPVHVPVANWKNHFFTANHLECENHIIYWSICPC